MHSGVLSMTNAEGETSSKSSEGEGEGGKCAAMLQKGQDEEDIVEELTTRGRAVGLVIALGA